jgi:hypothetical protein
VNTSPPPSEGFVRDTQLVGHWASTPFDVGAMESSEIAFLPDGSGWSVLASASGGLDVTGFRWHCPEPGRLELREYRLTSGTWERDTAPWCFAEVDTDEGCHDVVGSSYRIGPQDAPYGGEPIEGIAFDEAVAFSRLYARGERGVRPDQNPAHGWLPRLLE